MPESVREPVPEAAAFCDRCGLALTDADHGRCAAHRALEPPRYCDRCARRMVVQVTPHGWSARCVEHGVRTSG